MKKDSIKKIVYSSLFTALVFIGTQFIKFPLVVGYVNIGDCFVLLLGWLIGGIWGAIGSAIGSGLADFFSGYAIYAPITIIIKAIMAIITSTGFKFFSKKNKVFLLLGYTISGIIAELIMVLSYYIYETHLYGTATALLTLPGNLIQGLVSLILSLIIVCVLYKTGIIKKFRK